MLTICTPTAITSAASVASGIRSRTGTSRNAASSTQNPCSMDDLRLAAPDLTFATLRTATPVIGSPPRAPETMFAAP